MNQAVAQDYVWVRIKMDLTKPLICFVTLEVEGKQNMIFQVLYEKIPEFCNVCGLLGHVVLECGNGVHPPEAMQYGRWMLADIPWN